MPHGRYLVLEQLAAAVRAAVVIIAACAADEKKNDDYPDYPFAAIVAAVITKEHSESSFQILFILSRSPYISIV